MKEANNHPPPLSLPWSLLVYVSKYSFKNIMATY